MDNFHLTENKSVWESAYSKIPQKEQALDLDKQSPENLIDWLKMEYLRPYLPNEGIIVEVGVGSGRLLTRIGIENKNKYQLIGLDYFSSYSTGDFTFIKIGYGQNSTNPRVINLGYINEIDMPYLCNACDMFLHTSLYEGFGLPVLEAMACRCPVISSNSASLPEIVKDAGILLDANNVDSQDRFVDNIYDVLEQDELRNGLIKSKEFSWNRTARETIEVYKLTE